MGGKGQATLLINNDQSGTNKSDLEISKVVNKDQGTIKVSEGKQPQLSDWMAMIQSLSSDMNKKWEKFSGKSEQWGKQLSSHIKGVV